MELCGIYLWWNMSTNTLHDKMDHAVQCWQSAANMSGLWRRVPDRLTFRGALFVPGPKKGRRDASSKDSADGAVQCEILRRTAAAVSCVCFYFPEMPQKAREREREGRARERKKGDREQ